MEILRSLGGLRMPNFHEITNESNPQSIISKYINAYSEMTGRNVIVYYSGWLNHTQPKSGSSINDLDKNGFMSVIQGLDKSKGLDLFLHTPGGDVGATESLIDYLHDSFGGDIRAIIPQIAMSGGTMIACSCKEIVMGKQSSLGPIDPQFSGIPAEAIIKEFERAKEEVSKHPETTPIWQTMLSKYPPAFVIICENARKLSDEILEKSLTYSMFDESEKDSIEKIKEVLGSHENTKSHGRHLSAKECSNIGLKIKNMEDNNEFQDLILSVHHACMDFFNKNEGAIKLLANNQKKFFMQ